MTTFVAVSGPCMPGPNLPDEAILVARLRAGDEDAYEEFFRAHSGAMMAVARRFLSDPNDAADAVQDAFVSAFQAMPKFESNSRLGTWLHRITVNACLMKLRARKRNRLLPLDDAVPPVGRTVEDAVVRAEMVGWVRVCIDRLPTTYRAVILLRDIEGVGTPDAADRLGTNVGAMKVRLHRARQALRTLLEPVPGTAC